MDNISKGATVWMTSLDEDGFCGREYHPNRSDLGVTAEVVGIDFITFDAQDDGGQLAILKCLTFEPEPKFLEFVEYEVTVLT